MQTKLPPPPPILLLLLIIITTFTITAVPTSLGSNPHLLRLPSDDPTSTSFCTPSVNPSSCPVKCFRPDPVCGVDNVTYWCGCSEAVCAGVRVAKVGFCEFGNGGSGAVSGQALLLVHILWLILLGFFVLFGLL